MNKVTLQRVVPVLVLLSFLGFSAALFYLSPDTLLSFMSVQNVYLLMFFLAFLGGVSTFTGVPYHIILIALASTGVNPWLLGVLTAVGVTCGDTVSYLLGRQGEKLLNDRMRTVLAHLHRIEKRAPRLMTLVFFLYGALVPFSNDVLVIPSGMLGYSYWRVFIPLGVGTALFNISVALLAAHASSLVSWLL